MNEESQKCIHCHTVLNYFSGGDYCYCPKCNDRAYFEDGSWKYFSPDPWDDEDLEKGIK